MRHLLVALLGVPLLLAGCGGSHKASPPSYQDCANAWNASTNTHDRETVARLYAEGYRHAGIQLNETLGWSPYQKTDPNPVGCRVVVFNAQRWVAYLARRNRDGFVFRPRGRASQFVGDQRGGWPTSVKPGPRNARVLADGTLIARHLIDRGAVTRTR